MPLFAIILECTASRDSLFFLKKEVIIDIVATAGSFINFTHINFMLTLDGHVNH